MANLINIKTAELPFGVTKKDITYPKWNSKDKCDTTLGNYGSITLHYTAAFGWCIATLPISKGRNGMVGRTYGVRVNDGAGVRIGAGPHVTQTVTLYFRQSRAKALKIFAERYADGMIKANTTRDRISSRRAEGVEMRAAGHHSWRWSV